MMANFILPRIGRNSFEDDEIKKIQRDYGSDLLDSNNNRYRSNLYQELTPSFDSWIEMDRHREIVEDATLDKEALWRK